MRFAFKMQWLFAAAMVCLVSTKAHSQNSPLGGQVNGNFQMDAQYYQVDSAIGALPVPEKMLLNSWTNITYTQGNFNAGLRYEAYLNPVAGYDPRYRGNGVPYWFVDYKTGQFQVTAGHIYDQFGSGMVFRTYEEHNLGYDNSLNGVRVKFAPVQGLQLKTLYGVQRFFWDKGKGIVRGVDAEANLNELIKPMGTSELKISIGGSFVSKYQDDELINKTYKDPNKPTEPLILPLNVGAGAMRLNAAYGNLSFAGEYVHKDNDPNDHNGYIYRKGEAILLSLAYSKKGLGAFIQAKRLDNMTFKSQRTGADKYLDINYLPAITKQQTYTLAAMYPYGTIPNSEMGLQGQINYKIKKNTLLGGHFGTDVALNFSLVNAIQTDTLAEIADLSSTAGTLGYESPFFAIGNPKYYRDFVVEIGHRFSKLYKLNFMYMYEGVDPFSVFGHADPYFHSHIVVTDHTFKISNRDALRIEAQGLFTQKDKGSWAYLLAEYSIAPKWFFSLADLYNYGNDYSSERYHYPLAAIAYNNNANRIQVSYGRQREGVVCVGGVCRVVPASSGLMISVTTSF